MRNNFHIVRFRPPDQEVLPSQKLCECSSESMSSVPARITITFSGSLLLDDRRRFMSKVTKDDILWRFMSKVAKVATLLGTTESEARQFCIQVQKNFKGPLPSFKIIADCLEQHPTARASPEEAARIIKLTCPWIASASKRRSAKGRSPRGGGRLISDTPPTMSPIMARDPRNFTKNVKKCPHGVLKTRKCAICDPKGFAFETGLD